MRIYIAAIALAVAVSTCPAYAYQDLSETNAILDRAIRAKAQYMETYYQAQQAQLQYCAEHPRDCLSCRR